MGELTALMSDGIAKGIARPSAQRILVAVDASDAAISALTAARSLADARGATLAIVHVPASFSDAQPLIPQSYAINMARALELERIAREALERRISEVEGCSNVDRFFEPGTPAEGIVRRAAAWNADLIVVGSHGGKGILRYLLGSVSEQVARLAHCAVLVSRSRRGNGVVVVATDLLEASLPIVARAVEEATVRSARLVVMHAMESSRSVQTREWRDARLGDVMRRCGACGEPLVVNGGVVDGVVRVVEERQAELLVIGSQEPTGASPGSLGGAVERLVRRADCSVLVVRMPI